MCFLEHDFLPSLTSNLKEILGKWMHLIRSFGKRINWKIIINKDKTRMNFEGKNCASHASNHGHQGINVLKERLNTYKYFLIMTSMKGVWMKKFTLQIKRRHMR